MLYKEKKTGVIIDFSNKVITIVNLNGIENGWKRGHTFPYSISLPDGWEPYSFIAYLELIEK